MEDQRFKTMRHIETVRNLLNLCIVELLDRTEKHDQSKLQSPEREVFDEYTQKLRKTSYGSEEYNRYLEEMGKALDHHYLYEWHHPEHYPDGILGMNLIDLLEMICDWKAATLRHEDGDIYWSLKNNEQRFNIPPGLQRILQNTVRWIQKHQVYHWAEES